MLRNEFERRDHKIEIPSMSSRPDFAKLNAAIRNWTEKSAKLAGKTYSLTWLSHVLHAFEVQKVVAKV